MTNLSTRIIRIETDLIETIRTKYKKENPRKGAPANYPSDTLAIDWALRKVTEQ